MRKRNMIANATSAMLFSRAGGTGDLEERREEACVVCARKGWLENRFRCHLWKHFPAGDAQELAEKDVDMEAEEPTSAEEDGRGPETRRAALWRDGAGVDYFGDAARINDFLGVEHYAKAMPRIPLEELHTSSVQHPRYPEYRYLLHTRRVPTMQTSGRDGAAEPVQKAYVGGQALPRCAGVGVEESVVWKSRRAATRFA